MTPAGDEAAAVTTGEPSWLACAEAPVLLVTAPLPRLQPVAAMNASTRILDARFVRCVIACLVCNSQSDDSRFDRTDQRGTRGARKRSTLMDQSSRA